MYRSKLSKVGQHSPYVDAFKGGLQNNIFYVAKAHDNGRLGVEGKAAWGTAENIERLEEGIFEIVHMVLMTSILTASDISPKEITCSSGSLVSMKRFTKRRISGATRRTTSGLVSEASCACKKMRSESSSARAGSIFRKAAPCACRIP